MLAVATVNRLPICHSVDCRLSTVECVKPPTIAVASDPMGWEGLAWGDMGSRYGSRLRHT